ASHRLEKPDREPVAEPPAQLAGAEYRGGSGAAVAAVAAEQLGRTSDAPGVVEARAACVDVVALNAVVEDAPALHEERPAVAEELLERGEVEHGGIRLYLAEVRVDGCVHRDVGRQPVLEVQPGRGALRMRPGITRALRDVLRYHVRRELQPARRRQSPYAADNAGLRHVSLHTSPEQRPRYALARACDVAHDHESECVLILVGVANLAQRNAELGEPSGGVN